MDYDVIVIGCGTGGSKAAATAHRLGARVLAIDGADELGGLCILRGCMPTKTLLETAHRLHEIRDARRFGIRVAPPELDFAAHMERMRHLVRRFQRAKVGGIERAGYALARGHVRFVDAHTVEGTRGELAGQRLSARAFVLAVGSRARAFPLPVPPGVRLVDSDAMFELEAPPARALVVGGGAVGLEFAQWLARIGSRVVLVSRSPLLHALDPEVGAELSRALARELELCLPAEPTRLEPLADGAVRVTCRRPDGQETVHEVDLILNATGRVPAYDGLNLAATGASFDRDAIDLSFRLQASAPHLFVAGDATGGRELLHEANLEGEVAGRNAAHVALGGAVGELARYDTGTPDLEVIFTDPPVATVGATPLELRARGASFVEATKRFPEQGRGIVVGAEHGFVRIVAEPGGGALLGCQLIGPRADDLIHIPAAVLRLRGTVRQMYRIPWYHPTLAEAFIEVCRELAGE